MKAILFILGLMLFSTNAYSKSMKVSVKKFSGQIQVDQNLEVLNVEIGIGMNTCSWGWCGTGVNSSALQKLIPIDIKETDVENNFVISTKRSSKLSKFKAFTTLRSCKVGLRALVIDASGTEHEVEKTIFFNGDNEVCAKSKKLTPLIQEKLDNNIIQIILKDSKVSIEI